jgi:hypothetical protein
VAILTGLVRINFGANVPCYATSKVKSGRIKIVFSGNATCPMEWAKFQQKAAIQRYSPRVVDMAKSPS